MPTTWFHSETTYQPTLPSASVIKKCCSCGWRARYKNHGTQRGKVLRVVQMQLGTRVSSHRAKWELILHYQTSSRYPILRETKLKISKEKKLHRPENFLLCLSLLLLPACSTSSVLSLSINFCFCNLTWVPNSSSLLVTSRTWNRESKKSPYTPTQTGTTASKRSWISNRLSGHFLEMLCKAHILGWKSK